MRDYNRHPDSVLGHHAWVAKSIGHRLKEARQDAKLTQTEAAKALGIKQPSLSELETGESKEMSGATLALACSVYGVRAEWLMFDTGPKAASLKQEEWMVVHHYREMSPSHRIALHNFLEASPRQRDALTLAILENIFGTSDPEGRAVKQRHERRPPKPEDV